MIGNISPYQCPDCGKNTTTPLRCVACVREHIRKLALPKPPITDYERGYDAGKEGVAYEPSWSNKEWVMGYKDGEGDNTDWEDDPDLIPYWEDDWNGDGPPPEGTIRYNSSLNRMYVRNHGKWKEVGGLTNTERADIL